MANTRRRSTASAPPTIPIPEPPPPPVASPPLPLSPGFSPNEGEGETTGRYLVVFKDETFESPGEAVRSLNQTAGLKNVASAADYKDAAIDPSDAGSAEALYFPALGIAVVAADDDQLQSLMSVSADSSSDIIAVEPEYVFYRRVEASTTPREYLRGYRDAVNHVFDQLFGEAEEAELAAAVAFQDNAQFTWGLQAARVNTSRASGQGIRVAVLDTGMDLQHRDFQGRRFTTQSFIPGQTVQDGQGHGTHCIGTSCGPQRPPSGVRRYGCAFGADIFVGKVLNNSGSSVDSSVLNGMNWAVTNRCQVISMSLGANVNQVSQAFEQAGRRALQAGCLMVAAAGNNAQRSQGNFGFVGQPANSPSIMAVAALDNQLRIANFSARSSTATGDGGKVDIAGPGVAVFSSVPGGGHAFLSGTSMATPHVAGIAAMWSQVTGRTGMALWTTLLQNARRIAGDVRDIGSGLVQAPE